MLTKYVARGQWVKMELDFAYIAYKNISTSLYQSIWYHHKTSPTFIARKILCDANSAFFVIVLSLHFSVIIFINFYLNYLFI